MSHTKVLAEFRNWHVALVIVALTAGLFSGNVQPSQLAMFDSPIEGQSTNLTPRIWLPLVFKNFPPVATISRYIGRSDMATWSAFYNMGCQRGQSTPAGQDVAIILDFGYPAYQNGQYGVQFLITGDFTTTRTILEAVRGFLSGFYVCSSSGTHLTLALGVNNAGPSVTSAHGVAWAQLVNDLNDWIRTPPSWADKLTVWGAIDAEPGFGSPSATRAWVNGYDSINNPESLYLNFGSCDGCPYSGCSSCNPPNGWTLEDIWYVSWSAPPAYPLPEIYRTDGVNADQWYRVALYGVNTHSQLMHFRGSLTQWNACEENRRWDPNACIIFGNIKTDNRPEDGYLQLYNALNADPRTAQVMPWSSDISWEK